MISVVIPLYNERESLAHLHAELSDTAKRHGLDMEFIFVDDGSDDGSWPEIAGLARGDSRVRGVRLRRNFGKAAALAAGTGQARGELVCTLDADLQDDPAEIPKLLESLQSGLDVVNGWKRGRRDPWHKVWPSKVFNFLVNWWTGVRLHDHNCGLKLCRAEVFREIRLYGELHRFIPVLAHARGFKVGEQAVVHRPRRFGKSKYGVPRFLRGFLDLLTVKFLTGFGHRPQHLLGALGLMGFFFGLAGMAYLAVIWILTNFFGHDFAPLHHRPLLIYSAAALIVGVHLTTIGFLAELIIASRSRDEPAYAIAEIIEPPAPENQT